MMSWPRSFSYPIVSKYWYTIQIAITIPVPLPIGLNRSEMMHMAPIEAPPRMAAGLIYLFR